MRQFRQSQALLHTWSGLLLGWVMFIIFVAGTTAYWREELNRWMRPETPRVERPLAALAAAQATMTRLAPTAKTWFITVPSTRSAGTQVFWVPQPDPDKQGGRRPRRRDNQAMIDATGQVAPRETRGGEFFYRFHFDLHYLSVIWARWIVSVAAALMLVAILTGIVTHKKIFREFFTLRRAKGQRSWLDGHNAAGVLALPFHLMITYTGLVSLSAMLMPWTAIANYNDPATMFPQLFPVAPPVERTGRAAPMLPLADLVARAERTLGGPAGFVAVEEPNDAAARVTVTRASSATLATYGTQVAYDGATGREVWRAPAADGAKTTFGAMIGLHAGRFGDATLRWLYFACGIAGTLMVASGLVLWTVKRRERLRDPTRPPFGFRVVERLNIAIVAGFPLACAGLLWGNRVLPLGIAGRADREIAVMFYVWGAAIVLALLLSPRRGWSVLLAATAAALAGLVAFDALILSPGLPQWLAARDWTLVAVDAVLAVFAVGLGWTARRVWRHRARPRPDRHPRLGNSLASAS